MKDPRIYVAKLSATIWINTRPSYQFFHLFHVMRVCHSARQTAIAYRRRRVGQAKILHELEPTRSKVEELEGAIVDALGELLERTQT